MGGKKQIISSRDKQPDYPYKSAQFFKSSPKNDRDQVCTKRTYSKGSWISDSAPKREKSKRYTDGDRFFIVLDSLLSSKDSQNVFCIAPKFRTDYLSQTGDCQKKIFYVFFLRGHCLHTTPGGPYTHSRLNSPFVCHGHNWAYILPGAELIWLVRWTFGIRTIDIAPTVTRL